VSRLGDHGDSASGSVVTSTTAELQGTNVLTSAQLRSRGAVTCPIGGGIAQKGRSEGRGLRPRKSTLLNLPCPVAPPRTPGSKLAGPPEAGDGETGDDRFRSLAAPDRVRGVGIQGAERIVDGNGHHVRGPRCAYVPDPARREGVAGGIRPFGNFRLDPSQGPCLHRPPTCSAVVDVGIGRETMTLATRGNGMGSAILDPGNPISLRVFPRSHHLPKPRHERRAGAM
jgi:hypothetical protein